MVAARAQSRRTCPISRLSSPPQSSDAVPFAGELGTADEERVPVGREQELQLCNGHAALRRRDVVSTRIEEECVAVGFLPGCGKLPVHEELGSVGMRRVATSAIRWFLIGIT